MFGRGQKNTDVDSSSADAGIDAEVETPSGKGHPTPKRRDAEAARKQSLKLPADPKAAKRAMRDRDRAQRAKQREAMMRGEESALPARDRGPVKAFVRTWVDSRRRFAELFLPVVLVLLVMTLQPYMPLRIFASYAFYLVVLLLIADIAVLGMQLRRELAKKFPDKSERRGAVFYGVMRSLQIRRLRVPLPQVGPGGRPVVRKPKR